MRRLAILLVLASSSAASHLSAQSSASMPAVNDLPNPYRTVAGWAKLPEGRTWGSTSAVAIDKDGKSIWVYLGGDDGNWLDAKKPEGFQGTADAIEQRDDRHWSSSATECTRG